MKKESDLKIFKQNLNVNKKFYPKISDIWIEISGKCNAKCPYCARERFKNRYSGLIMPPELFKRILDHLQDMGFIDSLPIKVINLYNWGEPFLHPDINDILRILEKKKLSAGISSNFISKPNININNLHTIRYVVLSLSGFTQDSYSKIHGSSLRKTLDHFENFYKAIRIYSPKTKIIISWHRYLFNENELWRAHQYFNRPGIIFRPVVAFFNDLLEFISFTDGKLDEERLQKAKADLFINHISTKIEHLKNYSIHHPCFMWNQIVVDEEGQLLLCCGMTHEDREHRFGSLLNMEKEEILKKKLSDPFCKKCLLSGVPVSFNSIGYMPLPAGGGYSFFKLWWQMKLFYNYSNFIKGIKGLPIAGEIFKLFLKH